MCVCVYACTGIEDGEEGMRHEEVWKGNKNDIISPKILKFTTIVKGPDKAE